MPRQPGQILAWQHLYGSSRGLALVAAAAAHPGPVVVVTPDTRSAQQLEDELRFYAGPESAAPILPYPDWECLPYDAFSPHPDITSQRLLTLYRLPTLEQGLVVLPVSNLMQRVAPTDYVAGHSFLISTGEQLDIQALRSQLEKASYHCVGQVMGPGEFAVRGGLVDLYPAGSPRPYRIDLFGDEVEAIRYFDPDTQRSLENVAQIRLLPAREFPMTDDSIRRFRQAYRETFAGDPAAAPVYRDVSKGLAPAGIEYYFPLFFEHTATLFDYLPATALLVFEDGVEAAAENFAAEANQRYEDAALDIHRPVLPPQRLFLAPDAMATRAAAYPRVNILRLPEVEVPGEPAVFATRAPHHLPVNPKADSPYSLLLDTLQNFPGRILLVAETPGRRESLKAVLQERGLYPHAYEHWPAFLEGSDSLGLSVAPLETGAWLVEPTLAVITESQLYGEKVVQRRRRARHGRDPESVIRSLAELNIGDPVVHEEHGVGRYRGLQVLALEGAETEFLTLEYQDGDKLYIPILSLSLISRYTSTDPEHAPLHKLGGKEWERAKRRAREKVHDVAVELLEIQARRAARRGDALPGPDDSYAAFVADFPFEETPDQARAIDEVINDLEAPRPMDRLVCGDVGFGKTEVALRAAFLACHANRQAAVLVPTTLLAQQHYQNFCDRFADLPIRVELLSRFRTKKSLDTAIAGLADGTVDIVIGTHRLLQSDIRFKRLGLLIIDEEHRFGVRQKERIKKLRSEVDILTLTATPIPRTMNMAMAGLREISIIATPPQERLAVKTFVTEWNNALIREACLREIRRGGQVYFLHNDVRTMDKIATQLRELIPEAELRTAHGQMPERELEHVMQDFYHRRFNILVCSTIIESGIDVPTANTIIINRADKFGLAQLHQLRGRVGRSHHRAYAYLITPDRKALKGDALKRLEAIASLDELGAGFALASHDLEIRGAGELLGESQSGLIDEVGYTMYMDLLNRAVAYLKAGKELPAVDIDEPLHGGTDINLHIPVLLPDTYLPDAHTRLVLYKRIANASDRETLGELREEMIDRFGNLPEPAVNLFRVSELKQRATALGIEKIDLGARGGQVVFNDHPNIDAAAVVKLIQSEPAAYRMDGATRLRIKQDLPQGDDRIDFVAKLLGALKPHE